MASIGEADRQLDSEQAEQSRELDYRVERDRRGVLVRVTDGVTDYRRVMQRGALGMQIDLDDLLRVVPRAARIGHEDGLIQPEDGDRDEVADEEVRLDERERQSREEHADEHVDHALLLSLIH